ncbi:MAG TPA: hypothetical protein VEF76_10505 [Patescibacteria group bacterium]|nr:hypothetical protein [Patescibacteria group bacterium]
MVTIPKFLPLIATAVLSVAGIAYAWRLEQALESANRRLAHEKSASAALSSEITKIQERVSASEGKLEKNLEAVANFARKIESYDLAIGQLNSGGNNLTDEMTRQRYKIFYTMRYLLAKNTAPSPDDLVKPYSYYNSTEWKAAVAELVHGISGMSRLPPLEIGGGSLDEIRYGQAGDFHIDGVFYRNLELLGTKNSLPNIIYISAPGIAGSADHRLKLLLDSELDRVILDGCVQWSANASGDNTSWTSKDLEGYERVVDAPTDARVTIAEECEPRYLAHSLAGHVAGWWKNPPSVPEYAEFPFPEVPGKP